MEDVRAIGDGQGLPHIVIGDQDADAALLELPHDLLDVPDGDGVDAREGLVEQEVAGIGDEGARDLEAPPLASGQRIRPVARQRVSSSSASSSSRRAMRSAWERSRVSRMARRFSSTVILRNTDDSWGR